MVDLSLTRRRGQINFRTLSNNTFCRVIIAQFCQGHLGDCFELYLTSREISVARKQRCSVLIDYRTVRLVDRVAEVGGSNTCSCWVVLFASSQVVVHLERAYGVVIVVVIFGQGLLDVFGLKALVVLVGLLIVVLRTGVA